jgi:hypothetical protein
MVKSPDYSKLVDTTKEVLEQLTVPGKPLRQDYPVAMI